MQMQTLDCAQALAEGAWLVDVREPHETERLAFDHPQCVQLPLSRFQQQFHELPRDRLLVLACAAGGRSLQAMQFLVHHGFTQVANLTGGVGAWAAHGLPVRHGG
ncbi:rhodanese-like domain-containing protein [Inhella gelatinilytica]|uniref:Rhodanese-like domain-containing protein n=1 Tax=Inhella gelatinilytica TaxID=2795030 RepID=A0A931IVP9_9BURK|nr:rhodanese-like domain-containing protein [Inhella gelatinilytica]MBH9551864.1 rhodanese-like domain-containing protein [Inhella gelatinilytica]